MGFLEPMHDRYRSFTSDSDLFKFIQQIWKQIQERINSNITFQREIEKATILIIEYS